MAALTILPKLHSTDASGPGMNRNALGKVSVLVSQTHDNDESEQQEAALSTLLSNPNTDAGRNCYYTMPYVGPTQCGAWNIRQFEIARHRATAMKWPEYITRRHDNVVFGTNTQGLFTEINRAWAVVDNCLYLWDYEGRNKVQTYDKLDHLIVSVALVPVRRGVFIDKVSYVLVVATTVEIVLVAVAEEGYGVNDAVELFPTQFNVPTDGVIVLSVTGTAEGRIFMGGNDGVVYEIEYNNDNTLRGMLGLPNKCRKVNKTSSQVVAWVVPQFVREMVSPEDPIHQLVVDHARHLLYALTKKNNVYLYDLGDDGETLTFVHSLNVPQACTQVCQRRRQHDTSSRAQETYFRGLRAVDHHVISLHCLPQTDIYRNRTDARPKDYCHMIALCADGVRLFFTTLNVKAQGGARAARARAEKAETLALLHVGARGTEYGPIRSRPDVIPRKDKANRQVVDRQVDPLLLGQGQKQAFIDETSTDHIRVGYCDRNICITAESNTAFNAGAGEFPDSLTALAFDTAHHRFCDRTKRDPDVHDWIDSMDSGRNSNEILQKYNSLHKSLKESVQHFDGADRDLNMGRVTAIKVLEAPDDDIHNALYFSPRPLPTGGGPPRMGGGAGNPYGGGGGAAAAAAGQKRGSDQISAADGGAASAQNNYRGELVCLGPLAVQHLDPTVDVLCLHTKGLQRFQILRPVEQLRRILEVPVIETRVKHLNTFLYLYGRAETCAMCLIIACSLNSAVFDGTGDDIACDASAPPVRSGAAMGNASNLSATSRGIAQEIVDRAIKTFFDYGGDAKPFQRQGGNVYNVMARRAPAFGSNGGVRGSVEPLWSGKRNGIALYFSRLVRPFWDWTVTYSIRTEPEARLGAAGWFDSLGASARELSSGRPGVSWRLRYQLGDLAKLHAPVERLRQFMERNVATLQCESLRSDEDEQETAAANGGGGASQNFVAMQRNQLATASDSSARNQRELEIAKMKERRSLAELYHTTTRCSQALAALRILARPNHGFNKVVSDCIRLDARAVAAGEGPGPGAGASFETVLSSMTFKQLITEERGGKVIRRLLLQLLSRNDNDTDTRALARELMEKCPMFFSSFTELLALGRRFLERAKQYDNQPGKRERQDLLDGALDQYVRATKELEETPDRQFVDVVIQACDEFQEMQYYDGVLQLLLVAAHYIGEGKTKVMPAGWETWGDGWENAEPPAENDSLTDAGGRGAARGAAGRFGDRGGGRRMGSPGGAKQPRRSQAQASERLAARRVNLRIRLYQRVKHLFSYLLSVGQGGDDFLARILVRAQSYEDTMFHHMLYMFLIGEKRQGDFEGLSSPHVKMFLLRMIEKESRKDGGTARNEAMLNTCYESLVSYYKKNDQKRAAALILAQRALSDEISLQDNPMLESRINWLRDAVQLARSSPQAFAVAGDDGIGAETMLDWEESLDVALEQKKIIDNAFVNSGADEELRNKLQRKLLDISVLHKIAKQFSQWALCLSIIACSGSRGDDVKAEVKKNWNRIFKSCLLRLAGGKGAGEDLSAILQQPHRWVKPICDEILEKGRKFHGQARTSKGDFVVPVGYFIQLVEGLLLRFDARMEFEGHLVTTLRDVNITWMELVDSYSRKTVDVDNFLQLVGIQGTVSVPTIGKWKKDLHFLNKISVIINLWLDNVKRNQRPAEINELLSYIGGLREGVRQWKGECDHVQDANVSNYQAEVRAKLNAVEAMLNDFSSTYMNF